MQIQICAILLCDKTWIYKASWTSELQIEMDEDDNLINAIRLLEISQSHLA